MPHRPVRRPAALLAVAVAAVLVAASAGCARPAPPRGVLAGVADLRGASYVVAGGTTDELTILCQLTVAALQAAGARADEQCGKIGAVDVPGPRDAVEVDTGWAYVSAADPPASWADQARAGAARGVTWMAPTAFSDRDAVVVTGATARSGVRSLAALAARPGATLCGTADPAPGPGPRQVRLADADAVLVGVARGDCTAGRVPGTSGRIPALGLVSLTDGPGRGGAAPIMRTEVVDAHPQVVAVMRAVTDRLTDDAVRELNREVGVDGRDPRDVVHRWLSAVGLTP